MSYYLLLSRSITHAQRMSRVLERAGITARFFRPPMGLTDRGCSYAACLRPWNGCGARDLFLCAYFMRRAMARSAKLPYK